METSLQVGLLSDEDAGLEATPRRHALEQSQQLQLRRRAAGVWSDEWQRLRRTRTARCCLFWSFPILPTTATPEERRRFRVEKVLKLYRQRAWAEDATFWVSFIGLLLVMLQINALDSACRSRQHRFEALPLATQAQQLRDWQPPQHVDWIFDVFAVQSGEPKAFRAAAAAARNCSAYTSYSEVTDVCWCTGFSLALKKASLFSREFWIADNEETEGKRSVLALQLATSLLALVMVLFVLLRFVVNAKIITTRGNVHRATVERSSVGQAKTLDVRLRLSALCRKRTLSRLARLFFEIFLVSVHVPALCGNWYISSWVWINGWSKQSADRPVFFHYHATDLSCVLWLRVMWPLFRSLRNHSVFSGSEQARALALKLEEEGDDVKTGAMFAFKMMLRRQPVRLMVIITAMDVLATSSLVWTLEKAVPYGIERWTDCVWLTVVTMSTVSIM